MSNLNTVTLSLQKVKIKNLGENQEHLVNYLVKDYRFTIIRSALFNAKTFRLKSDLVGDATILVPDPQEDTEEVDIAANTIIHNETMDSLSTRETARNTTAEVPEVDDITTFIKKKKKINYLSKIMEKWLHKHKLEDQVNGLQNLNLSGNVVNNKPVTFDNDSYADLKYHIMELEKQLLEKNAIINYLTLELIPKSKDKTICCCSHNDNH